MLKHSTLQSVLLNAGNSDQPNRNSEEQAAVRETYDPGPAAKKQKHCTFQNMCCKLMIGCFVKIH